MRKTWLGLGLLVGGLSATSAAAATIEISAGEDIEAAIASLQPGDELVVGGGMYTVTERFSIDLTATEAMPIVIRAKDGELPHIHRPDANQNLVDIDNAVYVEIRGIEFSGGSAGLRISGADHLTIADCDIHGTEDVAVRANDTGVTYESLHIVHNNVHDTSGTGEGMYLGCNNGGCTIANSTIERNWVHHTNGPNIIQGDGIELKEGSYGNVIRDNVSHDTNYPCILTYSSLGGEANVIEGNVMWNCGDHGIQSAADATIRNNIILSAVADGIAMQPHQSGAPSNLTVVHNTIVIPDGRAISVSGATGPVTIANNAVYSMNNSAINLGGDTSQIVVAGNIGMGGLGGGGGGYADGSIDADFVAAMFSGGPPNDVFPADAALVGAGDPAYATDVDFNTLPLNDPPDVGAYAYDPDGNPGWAIAAEFKEFPDDVPGGDGGGSDGGGSDGGGSDGGGSADGGSADGGTGGGGDAGGDGSGGSGGLDGGLDGGDGGDGSGDDGGCGCRADATPRSGWLVWLGLGLLGMRRRRD